MSFPRYPAYKDSGVEWLGEVPEHWEILPLKRKVRLLTEKSERRDNPVALENIEGWSGRLIETETEFEGEGVAFQAGDILFGKLRPYLAKVYLADRNGEAIGDFHVMDPNEDVCPRLLQYQLLTREVIDLVNGSTYGAKMPRASWQFLGSLDLPLPPIIEQDPIACFLDHETAKIDALIAEQQRLIELLQEKRQAVISHAVTKGLNPDAPMKDSGVEWLGEVPEHWEVTRLGRIAAEINDINHEMPEAVAQGVPFLSAKDLDDNGNIHFDGDIKQISEQDFDRLSKKICPRKGDIIYSRIGTIGRACIVESETKFLVSYSCCVIRVSRQGVVLSFLRDLLASDLILTESKARIRAMGQPDLGLGEIKKFPIPLPPEREQHEIDEFLKAETLITDCLMADSRMAIDLLQERRSALISAAVKGQIDVRGLLPVEADA